MSEKLYYHDLNLLTVSQLKNARLHNVADGTEETSLAGSLGATHEGLIIYRADSDQIKYWNGSQFNGIGLEVVGDVIFKGTIDASVAIDDGGQPQVVEYIAGYQYVVSTAGTYAAGASGVTLQGEQELEVGDVILFTSAADAYAIQRSDSQATESTLGNVRLASNADVLAGTDTEEAVTPSGLQNKLDSQAYVKQYTTTMALTGSGTPDTVTHNLNLVNRDAFTINVMHNNSQVSFDIDSTDVDSLTLTSLVALTDVTVTVTGAGT